MKKFIVTKPFLKHGVRKEQALEEKRSISLSLTKDEYSFLQGIIKRSSDGKKVSLSTAKILRSLVRLLQHLKLEISDVNNEDQLLQRLEKAIEQI